MYLFSATS